MKRTTSSFAIVVAVAFLVVAVLAWQVAKTRDLGKQNQALIERTAALARQNTDSIRRLEALQRQAIKACVSRHKIVLALNEVARVNARRSQGVTRRNWLLLGIGIRAADCDAEQLRLSQQLVGPQEPKVTTPKVRLVIRYRTRYRTRTIRVFVPVNRTIRVPGPATVRVERVLVPGPTVTGPTVTTPGETRTVTVTIPGPPAAPPGKPTTTVATTVTTPGPPTTVTVPKPCKKPPCKP